MPPGGFGYSSCFLAFGSQVFARQVPFIGHTTIAVATGACENKATRPCETHAQSIPLAPISMLMPIDIERAEPAKKRPRHAWQGVRTIPNIEIGVRGGVHCTCGSGVCSGFIFANTGFK